MKVHITWMDGIERVYHCDNARVWDGVLVLQGRVRLDDDTADQRKRRVNVPTVNVRDWDDDTGDEPRSDVKLPIIRPSAVGGTRHAVHLQDRSPEDQDRDRCPG